MVEEAHNSHLIHWGEATLNLVCDDPLMEEKLRRVFSRHLALEVCQAARSFTSNPSPTVIKKSGWMGSEFSVATARRLCWSRP